MKRKFQYGFGIVALICLVSAVHSCRKSNNTHLWDVDVLVPLIKSTFSINDIVTDSLISTNPDNSIDVVYNSKLSAFDVIAIPDTTIDTLFFSPLMALLDSCDIIIPSNIDETYFQILPTQLTNIKIASGMMRIQVENSSRKVLDIRYQIPSATIGGKVFDKTVTVPAKTSSGPGTINTNFDLSGYDLDLRGKSKTKFNTFVSSIGIKVNCNDFKKDTIFPFSDYVKISNSFIDIDPGYAKGYFGKMTKVLSDTSYISLFNNIPNGSISLEDVKVNFKIENSVGVDARFTLKNFNSVNTKKAINVPLTGSIIGVPQNINRAADNNGTVIPSVFSTDFTYANSTMKSFFENFPDKISYDLSLAINPLGNISGGNDFYYKGRSIQSFISISFPLSLVSTNLTLVDTLDFSFDSDNIRDINHGAIYLYADNGFPFTAQVQLSLLDSKYALLDTLLTAPNLIAAPPLDANYLCIGKQKSKVSIPLPAAKLEDIKACKKIGVKVIFNTVGSPQYVKIYDYYKLDVKLVGDFNYAVHDRK